MHWQSPTIGTLECGCEVDAAMKITRHCSAHLIGTAIKLQPFSLDQAAKIRELDAELRSTRARLAKAQVQRHRTYLQLRREVREIQPPGPADS